jgi:hypothetical protein
VKRHRQCYMRSALAVIALASLPIAASQDAVVQQYAGNGTQNTRPFAVTQGWEIQWDTSGDIFQLYLHTASGDLVDVAANQMGSGSGASYFPKPGTYYLQVNAIGPWALRVVNLAAGPAQISNAPVTCRGNGTSNTRPFTSLGPWEVQWDASGDVFQVFVQDGSGNLVDVAANQLGPGRGASYQPRSGTYYLQVNATGAWSLQVVPVR